MIWPIRKNRDVANAEVRSALVGTHKPGSPTSEPNDHALGFATALQNALNGARQLIFPEEETMGESGTSFDVLIRFEAKVNVRNPGAIDEYRAVVTEP